MSFYIVSEFLEYPINYPVVVKVLFCLFQVQNGNMYMKKLFFILHSIKIVNIDEYSIFSYYCIESKLIRSSIRKRKCQKIPFIENLEFDSHILNTTITNTIAIAAIIISDGSRRHPQLYMMCQY